MNAWERRFLKWLSARAESGPGVMVGIGDDAAVLSSEDGLDWVFTTDTIADGTHFHLDEHTPERIGRKALAVSLSDVAAMGAVPRFALVNLTVPRGIELDAAQRMYQGLEAVAHTFGVQVVGGDTTRWSQPLVLSTTVLGTVPRGASWRMDAVQAGDRLLVTGPLGGSILGRHLDFEPRCALVGHLQGKYPVHAATDISDSLALDLHVMLEKSQVGGILRAAAIPIADAARELALQSQRAPLDHALTDGEDFELILAVAPETAAAMQRDPNLNHSLWDIGMATSGAGLWLEWEDGSRANIPPEGYSH